MYKLKYLNLDTFWHPAVFSYEYCITGLFVILIL